MGATCQEVDGNAVVKKEDALVAGNEVDTWLSAVKSYQNEGSSSQDQIVYSLDGEGKQVPIGIIINGPFTANEDSMQMSVPYERNEVVEQQWQWIAGNEECVTNEFLREDNLSGDKVDVEDANDKLEVREMEDCHTDVIKVYKMEASKKPTLKNLKMRKRATKMDPKVSTKFKPNKIKKQLVCNVMKKVRLFRKRKRRNDDCAYKAPQSAKGLILKGLFTNTCFPNRPFLKVSNFFFAMHN